MVSSNCTIKGVTDAFFGQLHYMWRIGHWNCSGGEGDHLRWRLGCQMFVLDDAHFLDNCCCDIHQGQKRILNAVFLYLLLVDGEKTLLNPAKQSI